MSVEEVWLIIVESGLTCFDKSGRVYCFRTEQDAVLEMADLIKSNPNRTLRLKKTKIQLPWL